MTPVSAKAAALDARLAALGSVLVAYSGGVDSAFLGVTAHRVLGDARPLRHRRQPELSRSPSRPRHRHRAGDSTAPRDGPDSEVEHPEYRANPANRCYYCKHELYTHLAAIARARGFDAVVDGSNADDRGDYRPGRQAAREFGVRQSARRGRADQRRDSRAGARSRACRRGTSRRRRACRRGSRITPK